MRAQSIIQITKHMPHKTKTFSDCCKHLKFHKNFHLTFTTSLSSNWNSKRNHKDVLYCTKDQNSQTLIINIPFYLEWLVKNVLENGYPTNTGGQYCSVTV
jgi:hypothetical protein